ncbi:SAM-dependent methyltransferase [Serpentinimonas raichei]|uniref:SAM-dependent methyltransferase n=1 Tax=Serpentinimonas raichei TaxID=1458425 RepID=A0A060NG67_9BURK|nr:class I SAM-dependent methyltransferase [Serpentinimonas raichei]BAO80671.1 SAM-dependent methyltransferase [Serpentinimonas raichei]
MKVCHCDRQYFYQILGVAFKALKVRPRVAELGVLRGENAARLQQALEPQTLLLVDPWSSAATALATHPFEDTLPWIDPPQVYHSYYGGDLGEQATFDRLYEECRQRFAGHSNVEILRQSADAALRTLKNRKEAALDLIYIDANHQYEWILRDLLLWSELCAPDGILMLNDCCHSAAGIRQNLGVLEAVGSFVKRSDFIPVLLTHTDWSDLILCRKAGVMELLLDQVISNIDLRYVEVPHQLLPAARVVQCANGYNISFK